MLIHARSMFGVPLGLLQGQGSHWGSQGMGFPLGLLLGMGFPLGRSWSGPRGPLALGTPQGILALWDPPRPPPSASWAGVPIGPLLGLCGSVP